MATSIVTISEHTRVPGNEAITDADAELRRRELFDPYHDRIRAELDARERAGRASVLVSVHSFTPSFKGEARKWHAGVLYQRDARLGRVVLEQLRANRICTSATTSPTPSRMPPTTASSRTASSAASRTSSSRFART